jgi:hypothetical protein
MVDHVAEHPIKIGVQLPGPGFLRMMVRLGNRGCGADGKGFDLHYPLQIARRVRQLHYRMTHASRHACVHHIFNSVFAGAAVCGARVYRLLHQKSGGHGTSWTNSVCNWALNLYAVDEILGPYAFESEMISENYAGDDEAVAMKTLTLEHVSACLDKYGIKMELDLPMPQPFQSVVFLSHSIVDRYVFCLRRYIAVTAGNLPKLLSSLKWVRRNAALSYQASQVAHLLGLRLCLFPWPQYWDLCEEMLDSLLRRVVLTPFIRGVLKARLSEWQMVLLHQRWESVNFSDLLSVTGQLKYVLRQFKGSLTRPSGTHTLFSRTIHALLGYSDISGDLCL